MSIAIQKIGPRKKRLRSILPGLREPRPSC
jgi:hypothetical protein